MLGISACSSSKGDIDCNSLLKQNKLSDESIKTYNSEEKLVKLLSKIGWNEEQNYNRIGIEEVHKTSKIEYLRRKGDTYYSIHLTKEGNRLYILYEKHGSNLVAVRSCLYSKSLSIDSFKGFNPEKKDFKLDDVKKLDPYCRVVIMSGMPYTRSFHFTADGGEVVYLYDTPTDKCISKSVKEASENNILNIVYEEDGFGLY